eukprot:scaffold1166_cov261-Pinguiococcus_pyrenoidosus.AAC.12
MWRHFFAPKSLHLLFRALRVAAAVVVASSRIEIADARALESRAGAERHEGLFAGASGRQDAVLLGILTRVGQVRCDRADEASCKEP